jgi:type IV secretion system protein VirD4
MFQALLCRAELLLASAAVFTGLAFLVANYPGTSLLAAIGLLFLYGRRRFGSGWVHGTSRLAGWGDLLKANMVGKQGHILGTTDYIATPSRLFALRQLLTSPLRHSVVAVRLALESVVGPAWGGSSVIRVPDAIHVASFSRTGGGKGTSVVIPTLLSHPGSMLITDPKSENYKITSRHRERRFKHRIVRLAPFDQGSDTCNPMDGIGHHTSPHMIDECGDLAAALTVRTGKEPDAHWLDSAESVLKTFIAFVAVTATPERRHLQTVRELLASRQKYQAALQMMQQAGGVAGGMLQRLGHTLSWHQDREEASVLATVQRLLSFMDSPVIAANMDHSSFNPRELKSGRMTIYLCLPPERLRELAGLQRLWITGILRAITPGADESRKVLLMLDEVANLGHFKILEDAVTLYRGMGIRCWFIFQSLNQVKETFGDAAETFLDNIGTQQFFGIQSFETAEAISKRLGERTVTTRSEQSGTSDSYPHSTSLDGKQTGNWGRSRNTTLSELARKLLTPSEILTMPKDLAITFHLNSPPILSKLIPYYSSPLFRSPLFGWLRTGRSPGLGLRGGTGSVLLLAASLVIGAVAIALPSVRVPLPRASAHAMRPGNPPRQIITSTPRRPVTGVPRGYQPPRPSTPSYGKTGGTVGSPR